MSEPQTNEAPVNETAPRAAGRGPSVKQLVIVVVVLAAGIGITALTSDVKKVSEPGVQLAGDKPVLVEKSGHWIGGELSGLSDEERKILPPDTQGARRQFTNDAGKQLNCSIILAGRDVTSIHRPEMCLEGQGWTQDSEYPAKIPVTSAPGGALEVMRMNMKRNMRVSAEQTVQVRSVFAYWFVGKDRITAHHWERILWTTRDRVLHNTNHRWAYILIHVPVIPVAADVKYAKSDEEAMQLIESFVQDMYPTLMLK